TLETAETSIRRLDELYRKFQRTDDRRGKRFARELAIKVKRQATHLAQQENLDIQRRAEQAEIVQWLTVWLQTPDLFDQWLELRKAAPEYKRTFADQPGGVEER